jgi:hypothetical protein
MERWFYVAGERGKVEHERLGIVVPDINKSILG